MSSKRLHRLVYLAVASVLSTTLPGCDDPFGTEGDRSPPEISLSSPAPGQALEGDSVVVEGVAEDDRGVERVSFRLNGGAEETVQIEPSRSVSFRFLLRGLKPGTNELEILARDAAEHAGSRKVAFSTRDVAPPVVQVGSPREGALVERDSVRITGIARDGYGVAALSYTLDGGPEQSVPVAAGKETAFGFTLRGTAPGEHTLTLLARDESGNTGTSTLRFTTASVALRITTPAPGATLTRLMDDLAASVEHDVPLSRITASLNGGGEVMLCESNPYAYGCNFESAGTHELRAAVDSLGNGKSTLTLYAYDRHGVKVGVATTTFTVAVPVKHYTLKYLGTLGGSDSQGTDLNDSGVVVGWSYTASGAKHAFAWDGARMVDVGRELGLESEAVAVNASGEIVGTYRADCLRAFYYKLGQGNPRRLVEECDHRPADINDAGKVVLSHQPPNSFAGAFLLDANGMHPLQSGDHSIRGVLRINNRDQVLGAIYHGYLSAVPAWLSPTAAPQQIESFWATDLNDLGHLTFLITGPTAVTMGQKHAFVQTDQRRDVVSLDRHFASPQALNDRVQVAGIHFHSVRKAGPWPHTYSYTHGVFFWEDGVTYSAQYGDPDWQVDRVVEINDSGVILAHATNSRTGQRGAVLLVPKS